MLKDDGWYVSDISGSHYQYRHPTKPEKESVPNHPGDIPKSADSTFVNMVLVDMTEYARQHSDKAVKKT